MRRANWLSVARVGDRPPARACRVRAPAAWAMAMAVAGGALVIQFQTHVSPTGESETTRERSRKITSKDRNTTTIDRQVGSKYRSPEPRAPRSLLHNTHKETSESGHTVRVTRALPLWRA